MWATPLAIAMILLPVRNERMGGGSGPSYVTNASLQARNRARTWLTENYHIVPDPPDITGWVLGTRHFPLPQ